MDGEGDMEQRIDVGMIILKENEVKYIHNSWQGHNYQEAKAGRRWPQNGRLDESC